MHNPPIRANVLLYERMGTENPLALPLAVSVLVLAVLSAATAQLTPVFHEGLRVVIIYLRGSTDYKQEQEHIHVDVLSLNRNIVQKQ